MFFCECCPKATLFGKKTEGAINVTSRYCNFTVKCGSELFQP